MADTERGDDVTGGENTPPDERPVETKDEELEDDKDESIGGKTEEEKGADDDINESNGCGVDGEKWTEDVGDGNEADRTRGDEMTDGEELDDGTKEETSDTAGHHSDKVEENSSIRFEENVVVNEQEGERLADNAEPHVDEENGEGDGDTGHEQQVEDGNKDENFYYENEESKREGGDIEDDDVGDSVSVRDTSGEIEAEQSKTSVNLVEAGDEKAVEDGEEVAPKAEKQKPTSGKKAKSVRVRSSKTVSSIEVDMTRIIRDDLDDDDDGDYDDAVTRVTCGKSVDFSVPVDEVEEELRMVINRPGSGRMSMMDNEDAIAVGRAATMNTPVTNDDRESFMYTRSIRTPSRDGIYEHALNLINNRCRSHSYSTRSQPAGRRRQETRPPPRSAASLPATLLSDGVPMFNLSNVVENINKDPFVDQPNSFFYIAQSMPLPMKPLKVWKGYRGNVYFEPMVCRSVRLSSQPLDTDSSYARSSRFPSISKSAPTSRGSSRGAKTENSVHFSTRSATTTRSLGRHQQPGTGGTKSALSTRSSNSRPLVILDKHTVLDRMDYNAAEDIKRINGIESTGTLHVGRGAGGGLQTGRAHTAYKKGEKHPKLRIRRGLVSHSLAQNNKNAPAKLGVRGGRIDDDSGLAPTSNNQSNARHPAPRRNSVDNRRRDSYRTVSQSHPADKYHCVDSMTALQQIMKRNERSQLVHILPSAFHENAPTIRTTGK